MAHNRTGLDFRPTQSAVLLFLFPGKSGPTTHPMARAAGNKKCPPIFEPLVRYSVRLLLLALGGVFVMSASSVDECYRRARDARRSAEMATMPSQKTHFLNLEQRWLLLNLEQRWLRAATSVAPPDTPPETIAEPKIPYVRKRRSSKFTPERIEQIRDLVARGKSREEIAGLLGVTVGTGISLRRRPKFGAGLNLPAHEAPYTGGTVPSPVKVNPVRFAWARSKTRLQHSGQTTSGASRWRAQISR